MSAVTTRTCLDCPLSLEGEHPSRKRCRPCAKARDNRGPGAHKLCVDCGGKCSRNSSARCKTCASRRIGRSLSVASQITDAPQTCEVCRKDFPRRYSQASKYREAWTAYRKRKFCSTECNGQSRIVHGRYSRFAKPTLPKQKRPRKVHRCRDCTLPVSDARAARCTPCAAANKKMLFATRGLGPCENCGELHNRFRGSGNKNDPRRFCGWPCYVSSVRPSQREP